MIVYCQFGHAKYLKEGQLIDIYINGEKLKMDNGDYLSAMAKRKTSRWYLKPIECKDGDIITLDVKVGMRCLGSDEDRTFIAVFRVSDACPEVEFKFPKVGYSYQFPLLKGKIEKVSLLTEKEQRLEKLKAKLENKDEQQPTN